MKTLISLLVSWPVALLAQLNPDAASSAKANISSIGNTYIIQNPAYLGFSSGTLLSLSSQNQFLLQPLNRFSVNYRQTFQKTGFAFDLQRYGYQLYNETQASGSVGLKLGTRTGLGISLGACKQSVAEGSTSPIKTLSQIGFYKNIGKWEIGSQVYFESRTLSCFKLGGRLQADKKIALLSEVTVNQIHPDYFSLAIDYQLVQSFQLYYGLKSAPFTNCFGFSFTLNSFSVIAAAQLHPVLGWSPTFTIAQKLGKS